MYIYIYTYIHIHVNVSPSIISFDPATPCMRNSIAGAEKVGK